MKSKIIISPEAKWQVHHDVDEKVSKDVGYLISAGVNSTAYILRTGGRHPQSKQNIRKFAGEYYRKVNHFLSIDPYDWPEYMKKECQLRGLDYDESWEELRDRKGDKPGKNRSILPSNRLMIDYRDRMEWAERGYIAGCMNSLAAFAAMDALGYSVKRAQNLFNSSMMLIEKAGDLDKTTWPDIIAGWLEGENIQFTGYWVTPDEGSPLPNLTEEQLHYLHISRSVLPDDKETRERTKWRSFKR